MLASEYIEIISTYDNIDNFPDNIEGIPPHFIPQSPHIRMLALLKKIIISLYVKDGIPDAESLFRETRIKIAEENSGVIYDQNSGAIDTYPPPPYSRENDPLRNIMMLLDGPVNQELVNQLNALQYQTIVRMTCRASGKGNWLYVFSDIMAPMPWTRDKLLLPQIGDVLEVHPAVSQGKIDRHNALEMSELFDLAASNISRAQNLVQNNPTIDAADIPRLIADLTQCRKNFVACAIAAKKLWDTSEKIKDFLDSNIKGTTVRDPWVERAERNVDRFEQNRDVISRTV